MDIAPDFEHPILKEPIRTLLNLLNALKEDYGFTYIFISHDLAVVKFMSDQLMVMNKGQIEELGEADAIYESPQKAYTKALIAAIPKGL